MTDTDPSAKLRLVGQGFHVGFSTATDSPEIHEALNNGEYAYCRICGAIAFYKEIAHRDKWRRRHWKRANHTDEELQALNASRLWLTPEAAYKLLPYGIFSPTDNLYSAEHADAAFEAPRSPL